MNNESGFFYNLSKFVVKRRNLFFLLFTVALIISIIKIPAVNIEYEITPYLPDSTETKQSIEIMDSEFYTFGSTNIMVKNITYKNAQKLYNELEERNFEGIKSITFDDSEDHYKDANALFTFTLQGQDGSTEAVAANKSIRTFLEDNSYDISVISVAGNNDFADNLLHDIIIVMGIVAVVIIVVLLLTSQCYFEVVIDFIIFGVAAILNMGTNYWFGKISFISNSVGIILQLALAIDYAIILTHKFTEEKLFHSNSEDALIHALSKAIPEISASSLTTVSGLVAMMFMQLRLGLDLGMVLAKGVIWSLICVFFLMPGLIMLFEKQLVRSEHRFLIPPMKGLANIVVKMRKILPIIFIAFVVYCVSLSGQVDYVFNQTTIDSLNKMESVIEKEEVEEVFGTNNVMAILVPTGDFEKERQVLNMMEEKEEVTLAMGLSNTKYKDIYITDKLSIKEFANVMDMNDNSVKGLYFAYALKDNDYSVINIDEYQVRFMDLIDFIYDQVDMGAITLDENQEKDIIKAHQDLADGKVQTLGENYSRLVFNIDLPLEGEETYDFLSQTRKDVSKYYDSALLVGSSTSSYDLYSSFTGDNFLVTGLTAIFVLSILLINFMSISIPVLLILAIEGSIFINFAIPIFQQSNVFFFTYLIVSAIQMGATIDYAIVLTSRFSVLKKKHNLCESARLSISQCFPTIMTSGSIMSVCGFLIAFVVHEPIVSSVGHFLGMGTLISLFSVLFILPELLIILDPINERAKFGIAHIFDRIGRDYEVVEPSAKAHINGKFSGYLSGDFSGTMVGKFYPRDEEKAEIKRKDLSEAAKRFAQQEAVKVNQQEINIQPSPPKKNNNNKKMNENIKGGKN